MGCKDGVFSEEENAVSALLSDALLYITMHLIGLPVDVHVRDGSVYTGTFYTASVEDNYAVVLKKAMMTKKGSQELNIENGSLVDTLVVQGEDLVQVLAKGVPVAENGNFGGKATSRRDNQCSVDKHHVDMTSQAGDGLDVKQSDDEEKTEYEGPEIVDPLHFSSSDKTKYKVIAVDVPSDASIPASVRLVDQSFEKHASEKSPYFNAVFGVSTDSKSNRSAKDSKLNPEAKVFTPRTYGHVVAIPAIVPSIGYILDPSMISTTDTFHPDYKVTGVAGDGTRPVIFASPYHFEAAHAYAFQYSQNTMEGQMGLPVYLPPLAHDAISAAGLSQLSLPPLLAQYQVHLPKHQVQKNGDSILNSQKSAHGVVCEVSRNDHQQVPSESDIQVTMYERLQWMPELFQSSSQQSIQILHQGSTC